MKNKMTNEEINRKVAEIAGKCWHEDEVIKEGRSGQGLDAHGDHNTGSPDVMGCRKCMTSPGSGWFLPTGFREREVFNLDYCSDLNLVREVEEGLVEEGLGEEYITYLHQELGNMWFVNTALANAKERCLAIIKTCT